MKLELLYFGDCPNWEVAAERLDDVASGRGLTVERRLVKTTEEAEAARFRGSPTILVDGQDPFAAGDEPLGLARSEEHTAELQSLMRNSYAGFCTQKKN